MAESGEEALVKLEEEAPESGLMKIGKVNYTRKPDDTILQLVWFSVRSGVGDVVGF